MKTLSILSAALLAAGVTNIQALPGTGAAHTHHSHVARADFRDDFDAFDNVNTWRCEYTCPLIETNRARFRLRSGVPPNNVGSWSKARYTPERFTSGRFTVSFSLTERPRDHPVWWGVALWDDGPAEDGSQFNEINFGYTTDQSYTDTELRFESAKRGEYVSLRVNTGVDLYDGEYHEATLEYDATRVAFYFDGRLLEEITDQAVIPTDPMDFILGPRLVTGGSPLTAGFTESIDWVEISS
jgi:hypothetical protein